MLPSLSCVSSVFACVRVWFRGIWLGGIDIGGEDGKFRDIGFYLVLVKYEFLLFGLLYVVLGNGMGVECF
jgi:hypothetical protein